MIPGEYRLRDEAIEINVGREKKSLRVDNLGDRPIQVGSHSHFFEVNRALRFDREAAYGFHLDIPAGTALRFEPGEGREVDLAAFAGKRQLYGLNQLVMGHLDSQKDAALARAKAAGYIDADASEA